MGDKIEVTTFPNQHDLFYRMSNNAFKFEVKSPTSVYIALAKRPSPPCDIWVAIGYQNTTWIGNSYTDNKKVKTIDILSKDDYRDFILLWNNDCVRLSRAGDSKPIIQYACSTSDIMYVTFNNQEASKQHAHWKFEIPPLLEPSVIVPVDSPKPKWVPFSNKIPDDALIGGFEGEPLYIMRAPHNGSLATGKLVSSKGIGYIAWGELAHEKKNFEVLCGHNCIWIKTFDGKVPAGAVISGYSEYQQGIMYVGRAEHNGHLIPGKVQPTHQVCFITFEGKEIPKRDFEVLVEPEYSIRSSNNNIDYTSQVISAPPSITIVQDSLILNQLLDKLHFKL